MAALYQCGLLTFSCKMLSKRRASLSGADDDRVITFCIHVILLLLNIILAR
jgi:hypothetical protein